MNNKIINFLIFFLISFSIQGENHPMNDEKPPQMTGPNCHTVKSAYSNDAGNSYKLINKDLINSASVPDAVEFNNRKLIYYVNGHFDKHSIYLSEIVGNGDQVKEIGPIKFDGKIIKDAVDPDVVITDDGKIRIFYYIGLFTKPVIGNVKPNKFYSAVSKDGINFNVEGVVAELDEATDPTAIKINDNLHLLALTKSTKQEIIIYESNDGKKFYELSKLNGGIPELSLSENGKPELLFQDAEGILKMESLDNGKSWQTITNNVLEGDSKGSASPSVLRLNSKERLLFYFKAEEGCTTSPTAYLEDKNSLGSNKIIEMGEPPLGHGVEPKQHSKKNNEMGEPPLGHGVEPKHKKK